MCSVRQRPMPCAPKSRRLCSIARCIGIGVNFQTCGHASAHFMKRSKSPEMEAATVGIASPINVPGGTVDGDVVALMNGLAGQCKLALLRSRTYDLAAAGYTAGTHTTRNNRCVGGHTAANGQDAFCMLPCLQYLPERFPDEPGQQLFAFACPFFGSIFSSKDNLAAGSARGSSQDPYRLLLQLSVLAASNCGCSRESSCFGSTMQNCFFVGVIMPSSTRSHGNLDCSSERYVYHFWSAA